MISIDCNSIEHESFVIRNLSQKVDQASDSVLYVRRNVSSKVQNNKNIRSRLNQMKREIRDLENELAQLSEVLKYAADRYGYCDDALYHKAQDISTLYVGRARHVKVSSIITGNNGSVSSIAKQIVKEGTLTSSVWWEMFTTHFNLKNVYYPEVVKGLAVGYGAMQLVDYYSNSGVVPVCLQAYEKRFIQKLSENHTANKEWWHNQVFSTSDFGNSMIFEQAVVANEPKANDTVYEWSVERAKTFAENLSYAEFSALSDTPNSYFNEAYFKDLDNVSLMLMLTGTSGSMTLLRKLKKDVREHPEALMRLKEENPEQFDRLFDLIDSTVTSSPYVSKDTHYFRNELNKYSGAPDHLDEMLKLSQNGQWKLLPSGKSLCHMYGVNGEYNLKFVSDDGRFEAVYNLDGELIIDDDGLGSVNMGTYNYVTPDNILGHGYYDYVPWKVHDNVPNQQETEADKFSISEAAQSYHDHYNNIINSNIENFEHYQV